MGSLYMVAAAYREMIRHCLAEKPLEACGLLSGSGGKVGRCWRITNINQSAVSFTMDGEQMDTALRHMKQDQHELMGIYHSHPDSSPYPSSFDVEHVVYPCSYLIISLNRLRPRVRSYHITGRDVCQEPIFLIEA